MKVAVTDLPAAMVMVQVPVPGQLLSLQPVKVEPGDAVAVKVTYVVLPK